MKHTKEIVIPEKTKTVIDYATCDLCGIDLDDAVKDSFAVSAVEIEMRKGTAFPECADIETTSYDMCAKCFSQKFIPWMCSQGAVPEVKKESY